MADALNQITNALKSGKKEVFVKRYSKFLLSILAIGKLKEYIEDYRIEGNTLRISINKLNKCGAIKPRYLVKSDEIEEYISRYLPSKYLGTIVISTSKGLMTHQTAIEKKIGGSLIAYFY